MSVCKYRGFTLVEVLISMVIMSLIITLAVSSYRYFFNFGNQDNIQDQDKALKRLTELQPINNAVRSSLAYYYLSGYEQQKKIFFQGEQRALSFITTKPALIDSPLAIGILLVRIDGAEDQLLYCELPLGSRDLSTFKVVDSDCDEGSKFEYLRANDISIDYFGWESRTDIENFTSGWFGRAEVNLTPKWFQNYDSGKTKLLPAYIRVTSIYEVGKKTWLPEELMWKLSEENPDSMRGNSNSEFEDL
ncbi:prepilin-type N-terminal cleavage/methylation domain-containing protein [Pseudoalteromonas sp. CO325X]|uniref:PulJ/GspJ family protein n=1 Tax=Pseudoalteromonas sp. CO325X TaxID=1777262 RepID=UPI0010233EEC|nr:prepilin-type N-terminal cleavage/methylation domain-containing protein [Pseudoalteromonas sp. CO325X]RZF79169.1 prepilin-type N-terminal cleavage/methylation domain-containing protein [Pseudoalteromonas sp. CO325X]